MKILNNRIAFFLLLSLFYIPRISAQNKTADLPLNHLLQDQIKKWELKPEDLSDLLLKDHFQSLHNGLSHYYYTQRYRGIEVYNAILGVHITAKGELGYTTSRLVPNLSEAIQSTVPVLNAEQAIRQAAKYLNLSGSFQLIPQTSPASKTALFEAPKLTKTPIEARLVYQPLEEKVYLAWEIFMEPLGKEDRWNLRINAQNGQLLKQDNWMLHCQFSPQKFGPIKPFKAPYEIKDLTNATPKLLADEGRYMVFPLPVESPLYGIRQLIKNPSDPLASPFGWHDTNGRSGPDHLITKGNNVHAYQDRNNSGVSKGDEPNGGTSLLFSHPFAEITDSLQKNLPAAVTQLFYTTNMVHDFAFHYGFDEAAGNFQQTNYSRRGEGDDPIWAQAQNGADIDNPDFRNNANFAITREGVPGVLQMYLWTPSNGNFLQVNHPENIAGLYQTGSAGFGPSISETPISGQVELALDDSSDPTKVCRPIINKEQIKGKVAMVYRGDCYFQEKVSNVEQAGAVACIVCNYENEIFQMGAPANAEDPGIPSVMLSYQDCELIRRSIKQGVQLSLRLPDEKTPNLIDGDFDNGIIVHEYVHGISTRLTGGASTAGCLTNDEQMGEGWSDFFALVLTHPKQQFDNITRGIGNYVIPLDARGGGIRRQPYSTDMKVNNQTFNDILGTSSNHEVGEIWSSMLWDLYWAFVEQYYWDNDLLTGNGGNNLALQLIMDGMKLQACDPGFIDARDAILEADRLNNEGANQCLIWEVFAKRGLGWSAQQKNAYNRNDGLEAFDLPPSCLSGLQLKKMVSPNVFAGDTIHISLNLTNYKSEDLSGLIITDLLDPGLIPILSSIQGTDDYEWNGNQMIFRLDQLKAGENNSIRYVVLSDPADYSISIFRDEVEEQHPIWKIRNLGGGTKWRISTDRINNNGQKTWHVPVSSNGNDQVLEMGQSIRLEGNQPALRFSHSFDMEVIKDGGFVQISTDGGIFWKNIDSLFFRNGYRGKLSPITLTQPDLQAFWGKQLDFIDSYIDLSVFSGQDIRIRFRFASNQENTGEEPEEAGWHVDDIELFDMQYHQTEACVTSAQGDRSCNRPIERGTIMEPVSPTTDIIIPDQVHNSSIRLFPNPARDQVNITILNLPLGNALLSIQTIDGKVIQQQKLDIQLNEQRLQLETAQWESGIYFLHLQTDQERFSARFVKQ